jgi:RES domain-containing protein
MQVYRIGSPQYISDISGTGGLYNPGRWHRKGTRILYTSQAASLAKLEVLANYEIIPPELKMATIEIPDALPLDTLDGKRLPAEWQNFDPYPPELADLASAWLSAGKFIGLWVPSVHPDFNQLKVVQISGVTFDKRLL